MTRADPLPRISFEVPRELMQRLDCRVQWGMKAALLRAIFTLVVEALETHGDGFLGFILAGKVRLQLKDQPHEQ